MGQTENYGLKQWESWEVPGREAINAAIAAVDGALAGLEADKAEVVTGAYAGDGQRERFIELGFTPDAVLLENTNGSRSGSLKSFQGGLILKDQPTNIGRIDTNGFTVWYLDASDLSLNGNSATRTYHYLVFR